MKDCCKKWSNYSKRINVEFTYCPECGKEYLDFYDVNDLIHPDQYCLPDEEDSI